MDEKGNIYHTGYTREDKDEYQTEKFISSNGIIPMFWFQSKRVSLANPQDTTLEVRLSRMNKKNWNDYVLPITYAWHTGFYNYGGKYWEGSMIVIEDEYVPETNQLDISELVFKYPNHSTPCAYGGRSEGGKISQYPLDKNLFKECYLKE